MYKVSIKCPEGKVFVYERHVASREEAEYAVSEAMIKYGSKHTVYIEHELESEFPENIEGS